MAGFDPAQFHDGFEQMRAILHQAWQKDLVAGFSGNASLVMPGGNILITGSGAAKGRLMAQNLCVMDKGGRLLAGQNPSSEAKMHLAIYAIREDCRAILHTHPPKLLALGSGCRARGRTRLAGACGRGGQGGPRSGHKGGVADKSWPLRPGRQSGYCPCIERGNGTSGGNSAGLRIIWQGLMFDIPGILPLDSPGIIHLLFSIRKSPGSGRKALMGLAASFGVFQCLQPQKSGHAKGASQKAPFAD